jgi:hypothetical protein
MPNQMPNQMPEQEKKVEKVESKELVPVSDLKKANNLTLVFGILFALSELMAQIPSVQSNSVFQIVYNILKASVLP